MKLIRIIFIIFFSCGSLNSFDTKCSLPEYIAFDNFGAGVEFGPTYVLTAKKLNYSDLNFKFRLSEEIIVDTIIYNEIKNIIASYYESILPKSTREVDYPDFKLYFSENAIFSFYLIKNCDYDVFKNVRGLKNQLELFLKIQKYVEEKNLNNPKLKECLEKVIKQIKSDIQIYGPKK